MSGLLLRLAGPLQSWGEHSAFGERDTCRFPTRSGLLGMFAAAEGWERTHPLNDYADLQITIRVDRPGVPLVDFHTVGGGYPPDRTVPTAEGKRRKPDAATIVSRRHYLADASFTVAVTAPPNSQAEAVVRRLGRALAAPKWPLYLGRRSCPPDAPLLLRTDVDDPIGELYRAVPVDGPPRNGPVTFVTELGNDVAGSDDFFRTELNDIPVAFSPRSRRYRSRQVVVTPHELPKHLFPSAESPYLDRLARYLAEVSR